MMIKIVYILSIALYMGVYDDKDFIHLVYCTMAGVYDDKDCRHLLYCIMGVYGDN